MIKVTVSTMVVMNGLAITAGSRPIRFAPRGRSVPTVFATKMAKKHPLCAYFAMEKVSDCVVLATEKAIEEKEEGRDNLRFIVDVADNLS